MSAATFQVDERLKDYASETQAKYIDAVNKAGSMRQAARDLGVNYRVVHDCINRVKANAARRGYSPGLAGMDGLLSDVEALKGRSLYHDVVTGKTTKVWIKTSVDDAKVEAIRRAALEALQEDLPRLDALPAPISRGNNSLCNCFVITDFHLGMLSHHEETGADWDVKIAEKLLVDWFSQAIAQAPNSEFAIFAQLSDFLHADGLEPLTPASKNVLDVDSRFYKVVRTAIRVLRRVIDMLLAKHQRLHVIMADANAHHHRSQPVAVQRIRVRQGGAVLPSRPQAQGGQRARGVRCAVPRAVWPNQIRLRPHGAPSQHRREGKQPDDCGTAPHACRA